MLRTVAPNSPTNSRHTAEPIKPAPPVTRIFIAVDSPCRESRDQFFSPLGSTKSIASAGGLDSIWLQVLLRLAELCCYLPKLTPSGSPFHGEGHRKVWARLRLAGVRTSKRRVLRLMREHGLLV